MVNKLTCADGNRIDRGKCGLRTAPLRDVCAPEALVFFLRKKVFPKDAGFLGQCHLAMAKDKPIDPSRDQIPTV